MAQKAENEKKKEPVLPVVVFKVDVKCDCSASKIKQYAKEFPGVVGVKFDKDTNQLKVTGNVDPRKLRDHLKTKTNKNVDIISLVKPPVKPSKPASVDIVAVAADAAAQKKSMEIRLRCPCCNQRIKEINLEVKEVQEVNRTVTMDVNSLTMLFKKMSNSNIKFV